MYTRSVSKIGVILTFEKHTVTLFEGDIVAGLTYRDIDTPDTIVTIDKARVRRIDATTTANRTMATGCPPDPYLYKYVKPTSIVFDVSDKNDADFLRLECYQIIDITSVNEVVDPEIVVDQIFSEIPGMIEVENNVYQFTTNNGSIFSLNLFDQIIEMDGFIDLQIHVIGEYGDIVISYQQCTDMTEFKTLVDQYIPKKLSDPIVDLKMHVLLA